MRKLLLLLALCCAPMWAQCANTSYGNGWTCIQQASNQNTGGAGTSVTVTMGATVGAHHGAIIVAEYCDDVSCTKSGLSSITATVASGAGDTFESWSGNPYESNAAPIDVRYYAWAVPDTKGGTTFTVTCSTTCYYLSAKVSEWTGMASSSVFDVGAGGSSASASTAPSVTAGTTTNATDLVYGIIANDDGLAVTPGSGFTEIGEGGNGWEHEAKSVISTGSQACTWTQASSNYDALCLTFKAGSGGGGSTSKRRGFIIK